MVVADLRHPRGAERSVSADGFGCGRDALERSASRAAAALREIEAATWRAMAEAGRTELADLAARVAATQHGLAAFARPAALGASRWCDRDAAGWRELASLGDAERAALRFAEQMALHVASLRDDERRALFAGLGAAALPFAQAAWAFDFVPRARAALDALFGASAWPAPEADALGAAPAPMAAIEALIRAVPRLDALDPITTELVRLLGARRHRCRLCQSLRSRPALAAGADEALFDAVERWADGALDPAPTAALAFADAMLGAPVRFAPAALAELRAHFAPEARVELVLDVTRNATNKVAVALAADAPHVERGTEVYDIGPDGELLYGLEAP